MGTRSRPGLSWRDHVRGHVTRCRPHDLGHRRRRVVEAPEGFLLVADFLSPTEQSALVRELVALAYEHGIFRGRRLRRGYAQFGYAYVSTGRKLQAVAVMPGFLSAVA